MYLTHAGSVFGSGKRRESPKVQLFLPAKSPSFSTSLFSFFFFSPPEAESVILKKVTSGCQTSASPSAGLMETPKRRPAKPNMPSSTWRQSAHEGEGEGEGEGENLIVCQSDVCASSCPSLPLSFPLSFPPFSRLQLISFLFSCPSFIVSFLLWFSRLVLPRLFLQATSIRTAVYPPAPLPPPLPPPSALPRPPQPSPFFLDFSVAARDFASSLFIWVRAL